MSVDEVAQLTCQPGGVTVAAVLRRCKINRNNLYNKIHTARHRLKYTITIKDGRITGSPPARRRTTRGR
jgi:hypothetical protein